MDHIVVETVSGSVYEIDLDNKRVRKAGSSTEALPEGAWKEYEHIMVEDGCLLIMWKESGKEFGNRATLSSPLKRVPTFEN